MSSVTKKSKKGGKQKEEDVPKETAPAEKEEKSDTSSSEEVPKVQKKRKKPRKPIKDDGSWFSLGNLCCMVILGGIGYCRYNGITIPVLDSLLSEFGMRGGGGERAPDASSTLADARDGKAMVLDDLSMQLSRFCGRQGKCTKEYWEALPTVAKSLQQGPGTWDRKPMKKNQAYDLDEMLAMVAKRPEARKKVTWDALRSISKELYDSSPKSLKKNLESRMVLKDAKPPAGPTEPQEEEEEVFPVDDL